MHRIARVLTLCLAMGAAAPALAQSEPEFVAAFAGEWQTLEPALSEGGACRVTLRDSAAEVGRYALDARNCAGALSGLRQWGIVDNQLGLLGENGAILARLGGNQTRMSGDLGAGGSVVFERIVQNSGEATASVTSANGCIYYGYTASCARAEDQQPPVRTGVDETARAAVLVALNARSEARPDAPVVATIPAGTCVVVDECTTASDGNWCRATVSNFSGWIRQKAMRANRWPVLTYAPTCSIR